MTELLDKLICFEEEVLRNTPCVNLGFNVFDDLSEDPKDQKNAELLSEYTRLKSANEANYHAIDYVFDLDSWDKTRFCDGTFPTWYGSLELETTFKETAYHWKYKLLGDANFLALDRPIYTLRTVFKIKCKATLIDLRNKVKDFPYLMQADVKQYQETQKLGNKLSQEGFPGLITSSARNKNGNNIVVFNKTILSDASLFCDYIYEISPGNENKIKVSRRKTKEAIFEA